MAEQADDVPARARLNTPLSESTITAPPSPTSFDGATEAFQDRKSQQKRSSDAAEYPGLVRRKHPYYNRRSNLQTYMDSMPSSKNATASPVAAKPGKPAPVAVDAHLANDPPAVKTPATRSSAGRASAAKSSAGKTRTAGIPAEDPADATVRSSGCEKKDTPRVDRAGYARPSNKKFLTRDLSGKLASGVTGQETQLEEIQAWIAEKKYTKFELLPDTSQYTFEDMDPSFATEPYNLKNKGRKLLVGKDGDTEVWAILPVHSKKLYQCRILLRDGTKGTFTAIKDMKHLNDSIEELHYPFEALTHSGRDDSWAQLLAVAGYVFLLCGEADVVFTDSSKGPHNLGTGLTCIKDTYAPNDDHPTAATVDRNIQLHGDTSGDMSETQLETINKIFRQKKVFDSMQTLVSDRSIYVFKDYTPGTLQAKGIAKAHDRALYLGEDGHVETWAVISREPNKAGLGWIVNCDKATGEQWVADFWSKIPTLTFPFEAFQQRGRELDWRKLTYMIAYVFLSCGEAEVALNKGKSFWKHGPSMPKDVAKHYGSISPPKAWPHVRKPGDISGAGLAQTPNDGAASSTTSPADGAHNVPDVVASSGGKHKPRNVAPKNRTKPEGSAVRNPLREILGPNFKLPVEKPRRITEPSISTLQLDRAYTAPNGEYRSIDDLQTALFLQEHRNSNGKRPASDDQENGPIKYKRLEATRAEATTLRLRQENKVEEVKRLLHEEERKMMLLQETELNLAAEMGDVTAAMTDQDLAELWRA
ncbi:hypothetical protein SLS60_010857 [Paraconiothyrium brasiliense]|uniref:Uncharacterized protein n=1 Tax=Paraconiothyrium brasiliense TaxID=300254 RepID=A0ABR3QMW6_9PLEO